MPAISPHSNVINFKPREPSRQEDERLLAAITEAEQLGLQVFVDDDEAVESAGAYVSEYLKRPLRTEAEVRAQRAAREGKVHSVFAPILNWWRGQ